MINTFSRSSLCGKLFRYGYHNISRTSLTNVNMLHTSNRLCYPRKIPSIKSTDPNSIKAPLAVSGKYKVFEDADSAVISNTSEEKVSENFLIDDYDEFQGLNTKRGVTGVYDIEDLVDILRKENARDVFVVSVPATIKYVDFICVVTGRNGKHILAMAEFIRKLFKRKCNSSDIIPALEGKTSTDWIALDLGNIALHIFSEEARELYDLETLWSVGHEYDPKCRTEESHLSNILERHEIFLHDLRPAKE